MLPPPPRPPRSSPSPSPSLGSSTSHASALPGSRGGVAFNSPATSNVNRIRNSFGRSSKKDNDADRIDIASRSSSSIKTDDKKEKKEKLRKAKHKRNISLQGTTEEARRIQNMIDKEWKDEKDKERRNRVKEEKKGKDERKAMKKDKSEQKKEKKKLRKQKTAPLSTSENTEDRSGLDNDFLLVTENFNRYVPCRHTSLLQQKVRLTVRLLRRVCCVRCVRCVRWCVCVQQAALSIGRSKGV
jgi:hypothetical protein